MNTEGIIFDIKKFAIHDGPGIRTTVFLKGCPLDCWWCHNPESRELEPETIRVKVRESGSNAPGVEKEEVFGRTATVTEVLEEIKKDRIFYDQSGGGATFSGGEPMMQPEFLSALLAACKESGISTVVDTSGYAPVEEFARIYDLVDLFLYDLKIMADSSHIEYTGVSNVLILDNLTWLAEKGKKVEVRIPLVPGITDTEDNLSAIAQFLAPLPNIHKICLLPYNQLGEDKRAKFNLHNRLGHLATQQDIEVIKQGRRFTTCGYEVSLRG